MTTSELITLHHLSRKAVIYIRQSTPHQALSHQESLRLQYALRQRAITLGWRETEIETIDTDVGLSGTSVDYRQGFQGLFARVALGEIGMILSIDVMRLCRNCSDWYPLLDICGCKGCLIADNDGIYDPGSPNGRLLLGLKGQLSELELHLLRSRMTAGLLNKAQRGDLALTLPVGLVRDAYDVVHKDPHQNVQHCIELIFTTFLRVKSANNVLRYFKAQQLSLPRRTQDAQIIWKPPRIAAILSILKNPAYAGAFVYGKTRTLERRTPCGKKAQQRLPMEQWKIVVKDKYPAYIPWETFECIQAMLAENMAIYDYNRFRGVPREGAALLQGLVYCGACGQKMGLQYKQGPQYLCNALRRQYGVPVCQRIPSEHIDAWVVEMFFEALSPIELDAYQRSVEQQSRQQQQLDLAYRQHIQRLQYQATLAQRQFNQVEPENRLVAAELEWRWEQSLRELKQAQETYEQYQQRPQTPLLPPVLQETFRAIGQRLPQLWQHAVLSNAQKKAFLRCLIEKVVIYRSAPDQISTRIVWKGGATTTQQIAIPVKSFSDLSFADEMEQEILALASQHVPDEEIATRLTEKGYRSPMSLMVLPSTVRRIRVFHGILHKPHQSHPRRVSGSLSVSQVARQLDVSLHWLYDRIHNGRIRIAKDPHTRNYLFPDTPKIFNQLQKLKHGEVTQVFIKKISEPNPGSSVPLDSDRSSP
jgi:DNA invertase Pin-like site-specific DNA recombinase